MFSSSKFISFFALALILTIFFLNSCGIEKDEYGKKSDYQKLGHECSVSTDTIPPSLTSESPEDNSTYNSVDTTASVTFTEALATGSVTTNTSDTTCSGSFQLSSDNFSTCIKMSAAPEASNDNKTFTVTPASSLSADTTFKYRITSPIADTSCNVVASDNTSIIGFSTAPTGSGNIAGYVQDADGDDLSGVAVSFKILANDADTVGTAEGDTTSADNGSYSKSSLYLGIHNLAYSKTGYLGTDQTDTLETDGETLDVETVRLLSDSCTSGTMSGTITDAVSGNALSSVWMYYKSGMNNPRPSGCYWACGWKFLGATEDNGSWSLPSDRWSAYLDITTVAPGHYTIFAFKYLYYNDTFNVYSCGNQTNQDHSLSSELDPGMMRIILRWPETSPATGDDLDSHLEIPYLTPRVSGTDCDGGSDKDDKCHLWFRTNQDSAATYTGVSTTDYHNYTDIVSSGDWVTLDRDERDAPGFEVVTISKVRSGTYSYSVHNHQDRTAAIGDAESKILKKSRAKVRVFYNDGSKLWRKRFNVPNDNGTLWRVFTFDKDASGPFTRMKDMEIGVDRFDVY